MFPPPDLAEPSGLLGVGGDLSVERLLLAYRTGIFPWYSRGQPILWWSPNPRMVLYSEELHVGRSLRKRIRRGDYTITMDTAFRQVMTACGKVPRPGQRDTWITDAMLEAYCELHDRGFAHSVEAWKDGELVGGLYGVATGKLYAGESMFAHAPDASKVAFVHVVQQLKRWGYPLVDCQVHTDHLARCKAREISRADYLTEVQRLVAEPESPGPWSFDEDFAVEV